MISKISIQNFRCFNSTEISNFKSINLIGGLNNSGKTVLLEAILLATAPSPDQLLYLKRLRGDEAESKEFPEYSWDGFFLNQDKLNPIVLTVEDNSKNNYTLLLKCDDNAESLLDLSNKGSAEESIASNFVNSENSIKSVLHAFYSKNDESPTPIFDIISHNEGMTGRKPNLPVTLFKVSYIPASFKRKASRLAIDYDLAEKKGHAEQVLKALRIIDKNIERIKVSLVGGTHLEIKREGENFVAVSLFGDAINKFINIALSVINNNNSILLIDEIENGVHSSVQYEFWLYLFQLTKDFNIQIFATTHSIEMLTAFKNVANSENFIKDAAYFELFKKKSDGNISYNLHEIDTLSFELANKMAIRGE